MIKSKNNLAITLDNKFIQLTEGSLINGKLNINKICKKKIESGVYSNGKILDKEKLKKDLLSLLKENGINSKNVYCTFDSTDVLTREIDTFDIENEEEMDLIIANEINQQLLINTDEYIIMYKKIESFFDMDTEKAKMFVAAMPTELSRELYDFFKDCKLKPTVLDLNVNSLEKFLSLDSNKKYSKGNIAILEATESNIKINILKNGKVRFSRRIDLIELGLTLDDIEQIDKKIKESVEEGIAQEDIQVSGSLQFKLDKLVNDLNMIIKFYTSRSFENNIETGYIYGEISKYKNIVNSLKEKINIDLNTVIIEDDVVTSKLEDMNDYINNFGVLLNNNK